MKTKINRYDEKKNKDKDLKVVKEKGKKKPRSILIIVAAILVSIFLITLAFLNFLARPADEKADFKYIEIKKGESTSEIASDLKEKNIIRSRYVFIYYSRVSGETIKSGHYKVSAKMSTPGIVEKLVSGDVDAFSITIPEGYRVLQIAKLLKEKNDIDPNQFVASAIGTEGTLFPDTYVFPKGLEDAKIVETMKDNFEKRTDGLDLDDSDLIIASIVEREAINDEERPKIASVYWNRVNNGMLLQADPTVRYALDTKTYLETESVDFDFWKPLKRSDYQDVSSPFNTYKQRGLPPAPICNPGLKSIEATLNPEDDFSALFFFHDKDQNIRFSDTYQEHLTQIQKYGVSGS